MEKVGLVIAPEDELLYARAAGPHLEKIVFLEQPEPRGYGDAICCGSSFLQGDPFLLMVCDHLYLSRDSTRSCARQLVEIASAERCTVSAVQATPEKSLSSFGAVGGTLFDGRPGLYEVNRVLEKPTPTVAEQELLVPGLRLGQYLCFFGLHVLTGAVLETLREQLIHAGDPKEVQLAGALDTLRGRERYLAAELAGRRHDLEQRYGLLVAQLALALDGENRAEILAHMVGLLADEH
jgi:UTP--glucose-1-phosphate uridylyltransferase